MFNITSPKDWAENREAHRAYIHGRTHFEESMKYRTADEIASAVKEAGCTHTFSNVYDGNVLTYKDSWRPTVSWFNLEKTYQICFTDIETKTEYQCELTLNTTGSYPLRQENQENPEAIASITWDAESKVFELTGEPRKTAGNLFISKDNIVTIKPVIFNLQNSEATTYNKVKQLESKFIPIDNKTIRQNADGLLQTNVTAEDVTFQTDFSVSKTFGKFEAGSIVNAKGKTSAQIIQEAFCGDLIPKNPEILERPSIDGFVTVKEDFSLSAAYEVGEEVSLSYELINFNPGKYSYGTRKGKDSNIYIDESKTKLYIITGGAEVEASEFFKTNTMPFGNLTTKLKVFYGRDDTDYAITSLGKEPDAPVRIEINADRQDPQPDLTLEGAICGVYRYFWGYRREENQINFEAPITTITRETFQHSSLFELPDTLTTTKAKQWFFAVPESAGISAIDLVNQNSGASTGLVKTMDISIDDAGGSTVKYKLFYITNAEADFNTNTYKINRPGGETS